MLLSLCFSLLNNNKVILKFKHWWWFMLPVSIKTYVRLCVERPLLLHKVCAAAVLVGVALPGGRIGTIVSCADHSCELRFRVSTCVSLPTARLQSFATPNGVTALSEYPAWVQRTLIFFITVAFPRSIFEISSDLPKKLLICDTVHKFLSNFVENFLPKFRRIEN